ncbi:hypothetical protein BaRGS_00040008, partial [Batillaria attramentaria]
MVHWKDVTETEMLPAGLAKKKEIQFTPLELAVLEGSLETVKLLVQNGAGLDGNARDTEDKTPLFYAVVGGRSKCCCALLRDEKLDARIMKERFEVKYPPLVPETRDPLTLLELAVRTCSVDTVKLLVEKGSGADMNARDKDKKTPLCWAVLEGKDKYAQTLLRHDGLDKKVFKERYRHTYGKPMTLLEHAISKCTFDTVKMLVDKGA